ncbi:MAG: redoxin domain-containing protein [Verrucomicrobiota bacterium]
MKSLSFFFAFVALATANCVIAQSGKPIPDGFTTLEIGDKAPGFTLPGVDGKEYSLSDFDEASVLMIIFTGTHCPTSHGIEERLQTMIDERVGKDYQLVAINPNHDSGLRPDEFGHTDYRETFEDSKRYAEDLGWEFPFLYDGYTQTTAKAYGCLATPHVFIFDKNRMLRYKGRYDDSRYPDPATVKSPDAINALDALLAGKPVPVEATRPHGCSTKWRERAAHVAAAEAKWQATEATIERIDAAGVAKLAKNGTEKLRLINVWATWCAPCVEEFPDLIDIARKFGHREFELITISLDDPSQEERALKFLSKQRAVKTDRLKKSVVAEGRATNNYLYTGASQDDLVEALDPEWPGPIPHTVLLDQDGKVLYRKNGMIDPEEVRTKILDTLTRYY